MATEEKIQFLREHKGFDKGGPISKFYEANPELGVNSFLWKEQEGRLKGFLGSEFWDRYNNLSALNRHMFQQDSKDAELNAFIDKSTRDYAKVPIEKMAEWTRRLSGYVPKATDIVGFSPEKIAETKQYVSQDPKLSAAYDQWLKAYSSVSDDPAYREYRARAEAIRMTENRYDAITDPAQRRAYLRENPELKAWRDWSAQFKRTHPQIASYLLWNSEFRKNNPELEKLLYSSGGATQASAKVPSSGTAPASRTATGPTTDYASQLDQAQRSAIFNTLNSAENQTALQEREAIYARYGSDAREVEQNYFKATDRRAYLQKYPWLSNLWAEKKVWATKYPKTEQLLLQLGQQASTSVAPRTTTGAYPSPSTGAPYSQQPQIRISRNGNPYVVVNGQVFFAPTQQGSRAPAPQYAPRPYYTYPPRTASSRAPNKWRDLVTKIGNNPQLIAALQEYLYQSKAGRPSVLAKYPFLASVLAGMSEVDIDALTADYLLVRRLARRPASAPSGNRLPY